MIAGKREEKEKDGKEREEQKASLVVSRYMGHEREEKKGGLIVSRYTMGKVGKATKRFLLRLRGRQEGGRRGDKEMLREWGWEAEKRLEVQ